jgi:alkanesulfonate monooxygenase SsuD/methylene tetrahydromethanopterin reductase-like flavin-dependent oxidoreductase (luciferase family)
MEPTPLTQSTLSRTIHLGVALDGAGWHPGAWAEPGTRPSELLTARYWTDQVAEARRGLLDFVTIEDSYRLRRAAGDNTRQRAPDPVRGRLDAVMIAARVAPLVPGIGLLPAAITTLTEPFLVSTQIATLDFISGGRAGWLAEVSSRAGDAAYVGPRTVPAGPAALAEAADHIEAVRRLWDSWEDGAEIRDAATNRFLDRDRIHPAEFAGMHFSVKGPSITPRPPQGQPIVAMLGEGPAALEVAVRCADIVLLRAAAEPSLRAALAELEDARAGPDAPDARARHAFADLVVFLDADGERAVDRRARLDAMLRAPAKGGPAEFAGTPEELAERLIEWRELGLSGFRLHPAVIPHDLEAVTRSLVPLLQERDVYRRAYEADTLRGLLGLARPANRYARRPVDQAAAARRRRPFPDAVPQ